MLRGTVAGFMKNSNVFDQNTNVTPTSTRRYIRIKNQDNHQPLGMMFSIVSLLSAQVVLLKFVNSNISSLVHPTHNLL
jgi:hypothetical protein